MGFLFQAARRGYSLVVVPRLLIVVASLVVMHSWSVGFSSCGAPVWLPYSMWDLSRLGINPCPLHWQVDS